MKIALLILALSSLLHAANDNAIFEINIWLTLIALSIIGAGIFAGAETAFTVINRFKIKLDADHGDKVAERIKILLHKPDRFIATTLVATNLCVVAASSLVSSLVLKLVKGVPYETVYLSIAPVLTTIILMIAGEIIPKIIAINYADVLSKYLYIPIWTCNYLLHPAVWLTSTISRGILALFKIKSKDPFTMDISRQDISRAISRGEEAGLLDNHERKMLASVLTFSSKTARDLMVPRLETIAAPVNATYKELISISQQYGISRIIIYENEIENTIGFVHILDLLLVKEEGQTARNFLRDLPYFPETKFCDKLLKDLKASRVGIAGIIDEFGTFQGIVTLEDLLEALFGDIKDEFDIEEDEDVKLLKDGTYAVYPGITIEELREKLQINIPPSGNYETLSGYLLYNFKRIPRKNEVHDKFGYEFKITEASSRKIELINIKKK
ncbi:MAG: HlyC/CorC family transporter [Candidatus Coatesbacteria bacterium]|nr:HlyC/CorC family transporter [Candidatus Coatesbacteria bacterium]